MGWLKKLVGGDQAPAAASKARRDESVVARGFAALEDGRWTDALAAARDARDAGVDVAEAHRLAAETLLASGRPREALEHFRRFRSDTAPTAASLLGHARAALAAGLVQEADRVSTEALALEPSCAAAVVAMCARLATGKAAEAADLGRGFVAAHEPDAETLAVLAEAELVTGRGDEAMLLLERSLALDPRRGRTWFQRARLLAARDCYPEALEAIARIDDCHDRESIKIDAFAAKAYITRMIGDLPGTVDVLRPNLGSVPHANSQHLYAETLLAMGRYPAGWRQFDFRWMHESLVGKRVFYGKPEWNGQDLRGKTVLVQAEQGIGDVVMFARFLPMLKERGARVLFVPRVDMDRVARRLPGVDVVLADGELLPPFDYIAYLMALPRVFGTTLETIPANVPYLEPDGAKASAWRERLAGDGRPRVGLVWGGRPTQERNRLRSIDLTRLLPVLRVPGVRFFSLQKGPAEAQIAALPSDVSIEALGPSFDDLEDLIASMSQMDLVISVCTGPAHIAGAMQLPVWTMVAEPPDLRWLTEREDSPWYPTMRLFRQSTPGEWDDVIARVAGELARAVASGASRPFDRHTSHDRAAQVAATEADDLDAGMAQIAETRFGVLMFDPDEPEVGTAIGYYGESRRAELELALRLASPGGVIVETGAGFGAHAIPVAMALGDTGHLLALEGHAARRLMLRQNLIAHQRPNVTILPPTASELPQSATPPRVDDLVLDRLDGIKGDAGSDVSAVLEGAQESIWRLRPWLVLALGETDVVADVATRVREFGYRTWSLEAPLFAGDNFNHRVDDVFAGRKWRTLVGVPEERGDIELPAACVELI